MKPDANKIIMQLDALQLQLGPAYLAYWALPNTVLTLSGARAYCDGVFWTNDTGTVLEHWNEEIALSAEVITAQTSVMWSEVGVKEPRPGEKYAGYEFIFETGLRKVLADTALLKTTKFETAKTQSDTRAISEILIADLRQQSRFKGLADEDLNHIAFGILAGYPDKAITESVRKWGNKDPFAEPFVYADIRGASYYTCPEPVYSYPRHLISDPSIVASERLWSKILKDYYTSDFHKSLKKDKAFQKKMKELGNLNS